MTEDAGRETRVVPVGGRNIVVRMLTDTQMLHLMRHAKILSSDSVETPGKLDSMDRMLTILNSVVVQETDKDWLVQAQESGEVDIKDMVGWVNAFKSESKAPVVRRARVKRA
jgi:hypothetical protein